MLTLFESLEAELNTQLGLEFGAHLQYLAIAAYFDRRNLENLAEFFYGQAEEEKEHGLKILKHISYAGGIVQIPSVKAPHNDFGSTQAALNLFLEQEAANTQRFLDMSKLALSEGDFSTFNFLQWFVTEQVEEMATANKLLMQYEEVGEDRIAQLEILLAEMGEHNGGGEG
jgi:bacterioferritin B